MKYNIESARKAIKYVENLEKGLKLLRSGSNILPVYAERIWKFFHRLSNSKAYCEREFERVGDPVRKNNVLFTM